MLDVAFQFNQVANRCMDLQAKTSDILKVLQSRIGTFWRRDCFFGIADFGRKKNLSTCHVMFVVVVKLWHLQDLTHNLK